MPDNKITETKSQKPDTPLPLQDRVAVVTGGNVGIGKAVARRLGKAGARLAICARSKDTLEAQAESLRSSGVEVLSQPCDLSKKSQIEEFARCVVDRFGQVDFLINNAGTSGHTSVSTPADDTWTEVIQINLDAPYFLMTRFVPHMPGGGRIVNISSILGRFGVPGYAAYCASKHGIIGLTRSAALELSSRHITVNAICPGWVETDLARKGMEAGAKSSGISYDQYRKRALEQVPLGDIIQPEEVAELVYFLLLPTAANITGQAYNICGGQTMD